jgi:hypothetical protein
MTKPPNSNYIIGELIKMKRFDDAQEKCDENVAFFDKKIEEQQALFVKAQCAKMGLEPTRDNLFATAASAPKRRVVYAAT